MEALRSPLPTTFRITAGKPSTKALLDAMNNVHLPYLTGVEYEGEIVPPPKQLSWYPEGLGWQINVRKNVLRKTDEFRRFQQFLVAETDVVRPSVLYWLSSKSG